MTLALVFPGQGSQSVGMMHELAADDALVGQTFQEASEVLGYDLWKRVQDGPEEQLNQTRCTQPAMLAAGVAAWRLWCARGGPEPDAAAGHSLGEYSALVAAKCLDFATAVSLVAERARLMQEAVPEGQGAIAAVLGLDDDVVVGICEQIGASAAPEMVAAVNFNSPGQVVIAGHRRAVQGALDAATKAGARRVVALPMSVPVHCELMRPAADGLAPILEQAELRPPSFPILHNAGIDTHATAAGIRRALTAQLFTPVRWSATVHAFKTLGVQRQIECGPGKVLTGLARRIDRSLRSAHISDKRSLEAALELAGADS